MGVVGEICCGFIGALRGLLEDHFGVIWGLPGDTLSQQVTNIKNCDKNTKCDKQFRL